MTPSAALTTIIRPTWRNVLPGKFVSPEAEVLLLAIGLKESLFEHREQVGGPARGFWQFEQDGGVSGVLNHPSSLRYAGAACAIRGVAATDRAVYLQLSKDDELACALARLLLWTDPAPLPAIGDEQGGFDTYLRNWRPGAWSRGTAAQRKTLRARWAADYAQAVATVQKGG